MHIRVSVKGTGTTQANTQESSKSSKTFPNPPYPSNETPWLMPHPTQRITNDLTSRTPTKGCQPSQPIHSNVPQVEYRTMCPKSPTNIPIWVMKTLQQLSHRCSKLDHTHRQCSAHIEKIYKHHHPFAARSTTLLK